MPRPQPHFESSNTRPSLSIDWEPSLSIDWEVYAALLEDSDMTMAQQRELIETLWSIVVMFVDLGFDLNPISQICGEDALLDGDELPDVVDLMNEHLGMNHNHEEDA